MSACDICHDGEATTTWRTLSTCEECREGGDYYDNLTPAERKADDEAIAQYCTETSGQ